MQPWRSAITEADAEHIWNRGYDVTDLMRHATYADVLFLLHRARLPTEAERHLIDAMLIASADHGAASPSATAARTAATGNRRGLEAAVAAGVLAVGDAHGGAGYACMELIAAGLADAVRDAITVEDAADRIVTRFIAAGERLPGLGHRSHKDTDPRASVLFEMAHDYGIAGAGIDFIRVLQRAACARIRSLPINVDGALAAVLHDLGFPPPVAKLLFITGRVGGLTAQVMEELTREQPMRIHVPVVYDGPAPRPLPNAARVPQRK